MLAERRNLFDFFKQLCENHKVDLAPRIKHGGCGTARPETMKFVNAHREKNEKAREQMKMMELL